MDRSDWIILGLLISVIIALSVDFSIGLKYLDTEIKADFNQNFDIKAVDATESKSFIISEGGSFNAGEKTLDGDCIEAQGVNNRLLENTYIDDNDWSESSALSKLKFSIMSNENVEDIKTFNKSSTTDIRDISVMNDKAYILLESLAYGCGRKGEGSHLVIINDKGEIESRKALNNLSGNSKVLKHIENGALYILSSGSIGKYSREGENYWVKDLGEDSSYKAKVFDVDDKIYVGLMNNNLNKFKVQKISRLGENCGKMKEKIFQVSKQHLHL